MLAETPETAESPRTAAGIGHETPAAVYTIDELAAAAGLPTRTVRHYQSEGLLPPPERKGRIALYRDEHLVRLRLIGDLQDRGLRLSAIRDALRQVEKGEMSLEDWLGVGEHLRRPWSQDAPIVLSEAELADRLGDRPGLISALVDARLVRRQRGLPPTYLVPKPGAPRHRPEAGGGGDRRAHRGRRCWAHPEAGEAGR